MDISEDQWNAWSVAERVEQLRQATNQNMRIINETLENHVAALREQQALVQKLSQIVAELRDKVNTGPFGPYRIPMS
jgi:predicted DNA-binding protein (UPF0278 family)